jgi:nitrate/nitrite transporter NarK
MHGGSISGFMQGMIGMFCLFAIAAILVAVSSWAINDARRRGKSSLFVWIAVVVFFPYGLVAWLLFRPAPVLQNRQATLRSEPT